MQPLVVEPQSQGDGLMIQSSEEPIQDETISGAFWHSADRQVRNWLRADRWSSHLCQDKLRPGSRTRKTCGIGWWWSLIKVLLKTCLWLFIPLATFVDWIFFSSPSEGEHLAVFLKLSCRSRLNYAYLRAFHARELFVNYARIRRNFGREMMQIWRIFKKIDPYLKCWLSLKIS